MPISPFGQDIVLPQAIDIDPEIAPLPSFIQDALSPIQNTKRSSNTGTSGGSKLEGSQTIPMGWIRTIGEEQTAKINVESFKHQKKDKESDSLLEKA